MRALNRRSLFRSLTALAGAVGIGKAAKAEPLSLIKTFGPDARWQPLHSGCPYTHQDCIDKGMRGFADDPLPGKLYSWNGSEYERTFPVNSKGQASGTFHSSIQPTTVVSTVPESYVTPHIYVLTASR